MLANTKLSPVIYRADSIKKGNKCIEIVEDILLAIILILSFFILFTDTGSEMAMSLIDVFFKTLFSWYL